MKFEDDVIRGIHNILEDHFPKNAYVVNEEFMKIIGGADTEIFSFVIEMQDKSKSLDLILRIYREGATILSSRKEFETLDQLYNAIRQLSEVDRGVILLYLEEKSYKEIAEIIGSNTNNIGVRIKRIKERLKKLLDGKVNWNNLERRVFKK